MRRVSIFVDESGNLGLKDKGKSYYIITLVFHDQDNDISEELNKLDKSLIELNCPKGAVHTEPLIRRESPYEEFTPNERRAIFAKLFFFAKKCNISYKTFIFEKQQFNDGMKLEGKIAREISLFIKDNLLFFQSFDEVVLYKEWKTYYIVVMTKKHKRIRLTEAHDNSYGTLIPIIAERCSNVEAILREK